MQLEGVNRDTNPFCSVHVWVLFDLVTLNLLRFSFVLRGRRLLVRCEMSVGTYLTPARRSQLERMTSIFFRIRETLNR